MKTFKTVLVTFIVTVLALSVGLVGFLFTEGIITVEKKAQAHNRTIIEDGVVVSEENWSETLGYEFQIDLADSTYVGK